ncbi:MAG: M1 family aminopeptidase [Bacteroidales bacterium]
MNNVRIWTAVLLLAAGCDPGQRDATADPRGTSHYDIQVQIDPEQQFIRASGRLHYRIPEDSLDEVSFKLHRALTVDNFTVNGEASYRLDTNRMEVPWLPDAIRIVHPAGKRYAKGEIIRVEFAYHGHITQWPEWSANVIGPEWTEMGLYFPWYPSIDQPFTYRVRVDMDPAYQVFVPGTPSRQGDGWFFESESPVHDLVVCAAKDLHIRETELSGQMFRIVNGPLSGATVDSIRADLESDYRTYTGWFGAIPPRDLTLVISKREKGGGYARSDALYLGGLTDSAYQHGRVDLRCYLAHEMAHFWWHGAPGDWEDWLNESFAEFSALLLVREAFGQEAYRALLDTKRQESRDTPPLWEIPRNDPSAYAVLYSKGPLLLSELEEALGLEKFMELCRARIDGEVNDTRGVLALVEAADGPATAAWFEEALRSK